jgi:acetyltransferase-like isoleucine patch superfamily enzyme
MREEIKHQLRWALPIRMVGLLTDWMPDNRVTIRIRGRLARPFIKECGENFQMGSMVTLLNTQKLKVGDNVYIARGGWLNALGGMELEDEVVMGPFVVISTLQHVFKNGSVRFGGSTAAPVKIGRGSWLAAHATVKCGVTVGKGNLVAGNAAVIKDSPDRVILGGVPAKVIGPVVDGEAQGLSREDFE